MIRHFQIEVLCLTIITMILLTTILLSCNKQNKEILGEMAVKEEAITLARSALGPTAKVLPNEDNTLFLVIEQNKPRATFLVTNLNGEIVYKKRSIHGRVEWHTNSAIMVQDLPNVLEDRSSKPSDYNQVIEIKQAH